MRFNFIKSSLKTAVLATSILLLGASLAVAQSVSLTAVRQPTDHADGAPYPCGAILAPRWWSCPPAPA